jgi:hypothetical protein
LFHLLIRMLIEGAQHLDVKGIHTLIGHD